MNRRIQKLFPQGHHLLEFESNIGIARQHKFRRLTDRNLRHINIENFCRYQRLLTPGIFNRPAEFAHALHTAVGLVPGTGSKYYRFFKKNGA